MFQQHENWWDLLCILDLPNHTGHVYGRGEKRTEDPLAMRSSAANHSAASNSSAAGSTRQNISYEDLPHYSVDHKFIVGVLSGIHHGSLNELWVRQQFYDYTFAIVNHTQDKGILINTNKLGEEAKKFLDANAERMQILSNTSEFREMVQNPWMLLCKNNSIETVTTGYQANLIEQKTIHTIDENRRRSADFTSKKVNLQLSDDIQSIAGDLANTKNDPTFVTPMKAKEGKESTQLSLQQPFTKTNNTDNNTPITPMTPSSPNKVSANGFLMKAYVRKLQYEKNINTFKEAPQYFLHLERNLNSESSLQALLLLLPESTGGLLPIAMGLFHPSPTVKLCTTNILSKLKLFKSTEQAFHSINGFIITAYERNLSKLEDGSLEIEAEKEQNFLAAIPSTPNLYDVRGVPSNAMKRELTPPMSGTDAEKKIESNNNSNSDTNIGERDSFTQLTESLTISSSIAMLQQSITDFVSDVDINNSDKPQGFSTTIDELDMIF